MFEDDNAVIDNDLFDEVEDGYVGYDDLLDNDVRAGFGIDEELYGDY